MGFYLILGICTIAIGLWNLMIAILGLFPHCQASTIGTLRNAKTKRNVRGFRGSIIPIQTDYVYTYCVKGKEYRYSGQDSHTKSHLLPKTSIVYVKGFPRHAYPNKFKGTNEWCIAFVMLLIGILAVFSAILS
jgi:hypothetical protein